MPIYYTRWKQLLSRSISAACGNEETAVVGLKLAENRQLITKLKSVCTYVHVATENNALVELTMYS